MNTNSELSQIRPEDHNGLQVERILLSVTVVHGSKMMQYDDSCAFLIGNGLKEYNGVVSVQAEVLYDHSKTDTHPEGCECGNCTYHTRMKEIGVDPFTGHPTDENLGTLHA
jgi:hypothetical protein